jgi:nucleoside phosphorylase/tetratricopeptide (TPR) repeat protein
METCEIFYVDPKMVRRSAQVRTRFDDAKMAELVATVQRVGILQPVLVRREGNELIAVAGDRRIQAAIEARLAKIPVCLADKPLDAAEVIERQMIENVAREDLSPLDQAMGIRGDKLTLGQAFHQAALIEMHTEEPVVASKHAERAEQLFRAIGDHNQARVVALIQAVLFVDLGQASNVVERLRTLADEFAMQNMEEEEAIARVNLAYALIKLGRVYDVTTHCERAMSLFKATGNSIGYATAVLNSQTVFIATHNVPRQIDVIRQLLRLSRELGSIRIEAGARNGQTVLYRRLGKASFAERSAKRGVEIARELQDWDLLATNLINLGNVYRDAERFGDARALYEEALDLGRKRSSTPIEAFALHVIADIEEQTDLKKSLELGAQSVRLWKSVKETYRAAVVLDDQARRLEKAGRRSEAAMTWEQAGHSWCNSGILNEAVESFAASVRVWHDLTDDDAALSTFGRSWDALKSAPDAGRGTGTGSLFEALPVTKRISVPLADVLPLAVRCISPNTDIATILSTVRAICVWFEPRDVPREPLFLFIKTCISRYAHDGSITFIMAAAHAFEQVVAADYDEDRCKSLFEQIHNSIDHVSYRSSNLTGDVWHIAIPAKKTPIIAITSTTLTVTMRTAAALSALLICAARKYIAEIVQNRRLRTPGLMIVCLTESDGREFGIVLPPEFRADMPLAIAGFDNRKRNAPVDSVAIVRDNFLFAMRRDKNPANKCSVWLLANLFNCSIRVLSKGRMQEQAIGPMRRTLVKHLFGVVVAHESDPERQAPEFEDSPVSDRDRRASPTLISREIKMMDTSQLDESPNKQPIDLAVFIALSEEFKVLFDDLNLTLRPVKDDKTGRYYYLTTRPSGDSKRPYRCVIAFAGGMGTQKAALVTHRMLDIWKPRSVINVGIAGALSDDIAVGDVVLATEVDQYLERSKAVSSHEPSSSTSEDQLERDDAQPDLNNWHFELAGEHYRCTEQLLNAFRSLPFAHSARYQQWERNGESRLTSLPIAASERTKLIEAGIVRVTPKVSDGPIASGPTVASSSPFVAFLKKRNRSYLAIEMEAAGVLHAVVEAGAQIQTAVVRGISDLADERKAKLDKQYRGALRSYAMQNALSWVWDAMAVDAFPRGPE